MKNAVVFYYEAKIVTEIQEKLLNRDGVYILRNFQRGIGQKFTPFNFFLLIYSSID